ncbi:hypothetical protein A8709_04675 [Paenibacillus pectinilyticus]|uniref:Uncharacterized protein n=1 Tax=Paenibacillus pectinilyticus TaxID=512399 RepID=A0A1C0ZSF3_9BACL|nr:minor capsid protein [Paenibacillus pectinilyticus]OCT11001.1 hypothetical protein A8709_04675 [Paenibacillus pectinilyticus]
MMNLGDQLALYLQSQAEGVIGTDLFLDNLAPTVDEAIWLGHIGGSAEFKLDGPDSWRKLSLQVRSATSAGAYERIWRAITKLLEPDEGVIEVEGNRYTVQITSLPALQDQDANGRFLMKCALIIRQVQSVAESWLDGLSQFTETALGPPWRVYRGFNGTCRPAVSWQCMSLQSASTSKGTAKLTKHYVGQIAARSASEYQLAARTLLAGLAEQVKLPVVDAYGRWITVVNSNVAMRSGDLSTGLLTVTVTGAVTAPQGTFPLMAAMHTETQIQN